jgi:hypothetical protein
MMVPTDLLLFGRACEEHLVPAGHDSKLQCGQCQSWRCLLLAGCWSLSSVKHSSIVSPYCHSSLPRLFSTRHLMHQVFCLLPPCFDWQASFIHTRKPAAAANPDQTNTVQRALMDQHIAKYYQLTRSSDLLVARCAALGSASEQGRPARTLVPPMRPLV